MPSKYGFLKEKYPKLHLDPSDASAQRVAKHKAALEGAERTEITETLKELRAERDALKERLKYNNEEIQARELWLSEWFEQEGITSIKDDQGFSFRDDPTPYAYVTDYDKFDVWADQHDWKDLYTINFNTLNANIKPLLLENQPLPDGVEVFMKPKIVITKPR